MDISLSTTAFGAEGRRGVTGAYECSRATDRKHDDPAVAAGTRSEFLRRRAGPNGLTIKKGEGDAARQRLSENGCQTSPARVARETGQ